jgi:hypothetical protein
VPIAVPEKLHATKRSSSGPENVKDSDSSSDGEPESEGHTDSDFNFDEDEDIYDWWGADADPIDYGSGDVPEEVYSPVTGVVEF